MKRLIVNADDFGLTPGVNRAIFELSQQNVLTSATIMATAPHFNEAVQVASASTRLGVGCHVVLVDGRPVLPAAEIPSLVVRGTEGEACFRPTLGAFLRELVLGRIREDEIKAEALAQIRRVQAEGIQVTHLDTHKHTHIYRRVLGPLLDAARSACVPAIRNPFEPRWSACAAPGKEWKRRLVVAALRLRRTGFTRMVRGRGLKTTDGALGIAGGAFDESMLRAILTAMPAGMWELVCHPGFVDEALERTRTKLRGSREVERRALLSILPAAPGIDHGLHLVSYRDL